MEPKEGLSGLKDDHVNGFVDSDVNELQMINVSLDRILKYFL